MGTDYFRFQTALFVLMVCGCSSKQPMIDVEQTYPVRGKVSLDGASIAGARVTFHSNPPGKFNGNPFAVTGSDGSFEVSTYRLNDGAPAGEFSVTVSWAPSRNPNGSDPEEGPERLPKRYQSPEKSGLLVTVLPKENELLAFDLKKK